MSDFWKKISANANRVAKKIIGNEGGITKQDKKMNSENYHSQFGGMWVDRLDFPEELERRISQKLFDLDYKPLIEEFEEHGFVILKKLIPDEIVDQILLDVDNITVKPNSFISRNNEKGYSYSTKEMQDNTSFRVIDLHVNSNATLSAILNKRIVDFLGVVFNDDVLAFQNLHFRYGSQQRLHQDTAYVVTNRPMEMAASWIALEDVHEGSGELLYYKGSHRIKDYVFGTGSKSWRPAIHGKESHVRCMDYWEEECQRLGLELQRFTPEKGDVLIWHAQLVHGGAKKYKDLTRKSVVTHYCPVQAEPNYAKFSPHFYMKKFSDYGYYSARHYDLQAINKEGDVEPVFMGHNYRKDFWRLDAESSADIALLSGAESVVDINQLVVASNGTRFRVPVFGVKSRSVAVIMTCSSPVKAKLFYSPWRSNEINDEVFKQAKSDDSNRLELVAHDINDKVALELEFLSVSEKMVISDLHIEEVI